jgi:predicted transcriptional regulator
VGQGRKRFYAFFEALTMLLCRDMPMAAVAEGLGEHDTGSFSTSNSAAGLAFSNPDKTSREGL